jgi:type I restriction enzyme S subunit
MSQALPKDVTQTLRRWKRYSAYKDSDVEWLGEIPEHWEVTKLGAKCSVKARLGWKGLKASEYVEEGYIFLSTPNIKEKKIDFDNVNYITADRYFESPEIMLEVDDVLIAKDGSTLGIVNVVRSLPAPTTVNSSIAVIRHKQSFDSVFLYYFLASDYTQNVIQSMKDGMGVPHLFQADLRKFTVLTPPISEQQAIASFLDRETAKIDALIAKKERLIELLQEKRTAIISHAVTKGLDPTVPLKDSGVEWLGEIPAHWKCHLFRRVIQSMCDGPFGSDMKSSHYANEGVRLIRLQNIGQGYFDNSDKAYIPEEHFLSLPGHDAAPGDLLIAGLGDQNNAVGRACLVPDDVNRAMVKADCFRIRLNQQQLLHIFAMYLLCSSIARAGVKLQTRGATRDRINLSGTAQLHVVIPPLDEQKAIASYLDREIVKIDALIAKIREGIEKLKEYRTALISAAVTGKIDVRNEVAS